MKQLLFVLMAVAGFSQESGETAPKPEAKKEYLLTKEESLTVKLDIAQIQLLNEKYKIDDYNKEIKPWSAEQEDVITKACMKVGVAKDKIRSDCGVSLGAKDQAGNELPAKVWKIEKVTAPAK